MKGDKTSEVPRSGAKGGDGGDTVSGHERESLSYGGSESGAEKVGQGTSLLGGGGGGGGGGGAPVTMRPRDNVLPPKTAKEANERLKDEGFK